MNTYERSKAQAFKIEKVFVAMGTSWRGSTVKRDGKSVDCGHKHKTKEAAERCQRKMRKLRPGKCQDYRIIQFELHHIKRPKVG